MPEIVHLPPEFCAPSDAPALADILSENLVEVGTDLPSRWFPSDDSGAEWAMRNLARFTEQREAVRKQAAEWMRQIVEWLEREEKNLSRATTYFERVLQQYALARRAVDEDAKTLRLPSGEVRTTGHKPKLTITDQDALIQFLKDTDHADLIRTTEDVLVSTLNEHVKVLRHPAIYTVSMDCGDRFDSVDTAVRFCRVCGAEGAVIEVEQDVWESWEAVLDGGVIPGVEVEPAHVTAKVVVL